MSTVWTGKAAGAALWICLACASSGPPVAEHSLGRAPRTIGNVAMVSDLMRDGNDDSVLSALRRYRPNFLRSRGSATPLVVMEGYPNMDISVLGPMRLSEISKVTFLRAPSEFDCCRDVLHLSRLQR